jgi:hypothetical protein
MYNQGKYQELVDDDRKSYEQWVHYAENRVKIRGRKSYGDKFREAGPRTLQTLAEPVHQIDHTVRAATVGRRFFLTHSGLMGLRPPSLRVGDDVYVLTRASTPFILR